MAGTQPRPTIVTQSNRYGEDRRSASRVVPKEPHPTRLRPALRAAIKVVPVPQNGSSTVSPTKENILTSLEASSSGNGAGWFLVQAPVMFQICLNQLSKSFFLILLSSLCFSVGCLYPPGFLCISMNSISFLIMAFGSWGLPRNLLPFATSKLAFDILCQIIGLRLSKPIFLSNIKIESLWTGSAGVHSVRQAFIRHTVDYPVRWHYVFPALQIENTSRRWGCQRGQFGVHELFFECERLVQQKLKT